MKLNNIYRLTINGDNLRQYHLRSRWMVELYMQTYRQIGRQICLEQLVNGIWEPLQLQYTGA